MLCQELEVNDYTDLLAKVRKLKIKHKQYKKEKKLIVNMKMLVKDSNGLSGNLMNPDPQKTNFSTIDTNNIKR